MKSKRTLVIVMIIGGIALIAGSYCFYLMTIPLSSDYVYVVVGGFLLSLAVFVAAAITAIVIAMKLRDSKRP